MLDRMLPLGALVLLPFTARLLEPPALAQEAAPPVPAQRPLATLLPERTLVAIEAPGLAALLDEGLEHPLMHALAEGGPGQLFAAETGSTPAEMLAAADAYLGQPLLPVLAELSRNGAALGLGLGGGELSWALLLHAADEGILRASLEDAFGRLEQQFDAPGAFDKPHRRVAGADVWGLGDDVQLAARGALFVASNHEATLEDVLDLAAQPDAKGLTARESYRDAFAHTASAPLLRAWVDVERMEMLAELTGGGGNAMKKLRAFPRTPEAQLLLGPGVASLGTADVFAAEVDVRGMRLDLRVSGIGAEEAEPLAVDAKRALPPALRPHDDDCGSLLAYRDFAAAFTRRAELFDADRMPGFAKAEADLSLFFGGADFAEDVLPGISPWMRVIARRPAYDAGTVPEIPLPGALALLKLEDADTMGPRLMSAFQTFIGAINLDRAQKGEASFLLALEAVEGVQVTGAHLPKPGPEDGVDAEYNLAPGCAVVGDTLLLATHVSLVRDAVRELSAGATASDSDPVEHLTLDGAALARLIEDNRSLLVMQNALEEGNSMEAAEAEIEALRMLVATVTNARMAASRPQPDRTLFELSLDLAPVDAEDQR
ncbi:MAG: hypothetical protein AAF682_03440 [Planctomycetota bacterium]